VAQSFYHVSDRGCDDSRSRDRVVAILDLPVPLVISNGRVVADLASDGAEESFRVCSSTEKMHFMV
jgi:hypothetical protein